MQSKGWTTHYTFIWPVLLLIVAFGIIILLLLLLLLLSLSLVLIRFRLSLPAECCHIVDVLETFLLLYFYFRSGFPPWCYCRLGIILFPHGRRFCVCLPIWRWCQWHHQKLKKTHTLMFTSLWHAAKAVAHKWVQGIVPWLLTATFL
jgi:hypothetical protein